MDLHLPEECKIVEALAPATDSAGRTGTYVSMKNVHMAWLVYHLTQGAANTVALSLTEATAVAGTATQAISATFPIWSCLDMATSDTLVKRTSAASYTTDAGTTHKVIVFQVDPAILSSTFDCVAPVTGASSASNISSALWYLDTRYDGASMPSAITD